MLPFPNFKRLAKNEEPSVAIIREALNLDIDRYRQPYTHAFAVLVVWIDAISLANYSGDSSARNISISVELRSDDTIADTASMSPRAAAKAKALGVGALPCAYGKAASKSRVQSVSTPLVYHQQRAQVNERMKIFLF